MITLLSVPPRLGANDGLQAVSTVLARAEEVLEATFSQIGERLDRLESNVSRVQKKAEKMHRKVTEISTDLQSGEKNVEVLITSKPVVPRVGLIPPLVDVPPPTQTVAAPSQARVPEISTIEKMANSISVSDLTLAPLPRKFPDDDTDSATFDAVPAIHGEGESSIFLPTVSALSPRPLERTDVLVLGTPGSRRLSALLETTEIEEFQSQLEDVPEVPDLSDEPSVEEEKPVPPSVHFSPIVQKPHSPQPPPTPTASFDPFAVTPGAGKIHRVNPAQLTRASPRAAPPSFLAQIRAGTKLTKAEPLEKPASVASPMAELRNKLAARRQSLLSPKKSAAEVRMMGRLSEADLNLLSPVSRMGALAAQRHAELDSDSDSSGW